MEQNPQLNQKIFDTLPAPIAVVNETGEIIAANKAWKLSAAASAKPGWPRWEIGANLLDAPKGGNSPYGDDNNAACSGIKGVLGGLLPDFALEFSCDSSKAKQWFLLEVFPIEGTPIKAVVSHLNITHHRHIENQLQTADDENCKLAAIIEYANDAIVSLTLAGIVISWNQGAERLYGYSAEEMVGHSILILHPLEKQDEYHSLMRRAKAGERVSGFDTVRRRKDGTLIDVSLSVAAIEVQDGDVTGVSMISHDISKIKLLEERFRQSQKMEALGKFAGGVAHDMNNLLTISMGYTEMLIRQLLPTDPKQELLTQIHNAEKRATDLAHQLLAFSRKQVLEPKVLSLNSSVINIETMLRRLIGEDVIMSTLLDPDLKLVKVDPGQIQQVLMNLALNARDAMPQGGRMTVETRNVIFDEKLSQSHPEVPPGLYSVLSVTDSGKGMDAETKAHIFEPFFTTKEVSKGTGLGMAVVHGIVKQSGGYIEVESELGQGARITIYFPQVGDVVASSTALPGIPPLPHGNETLLLVEDEAGVREIALLILRSCGYTLLQASDGLEAMRIASNHAGPIHLVVSDVVMPHLGGRQLSERLSAIRPDIKILFVSGYTDDAIVRHGVIEHNVSFLQKPFTPTSLAQKVREVLDDTIVSDVGSKPVETFDVVQEASEESFPASDSPAY